MKSLDKIVYISLILIFTGLICRAQAIPVRTDSLKVTAKEAGNQEKVQSQDQNQGQTAGENQAGNQNRDQGQIQGNSQSDAPGQKVKQIKSARPDFSKAKGARPNIKRPAGSGIPKGVGKPGGVGKGRGR